MKSLKKKFVNKLIKSNHKQEKKTLNKALKGRLHIDNDIDVFTFSLRVCNILNSFDISQSQYDNAFYYGYHEIPLIKIAKTVLKHTEKLLDDETYNQACIAELIVAGYMIRYGLEYSDLKRRARKKLYALECYQKNVLSEATNVRQELFTLNDAMDIMRGLFPDQFMK